uniref:Uncharacterized protein n=1 Tax=Glossina palpalis gambiensis TaxID=67801 RepID=A0A1B0AVK0_9MUSC
MFSTTIALLAQKVDSNQNCLQNLAYPYIGFDRVSVAKLEERSRKSLPVVAVCGIAVLVAVFSCHSLLLLLLLFCSKACAGTK